ncbi:MAG: hypothetical protein KIS67_08375 [Verrucomicrobiae bacterium]|nr:hypothetical protein [Verrucomicrobiae bacterium]
MTNLYPIIRRKRRPLIVAESVPDGPPSAVKADATKAVEPVVTDKPQASDDKSTSELDA